LSKAALDEIINDMSTQAYRQEILAEDVNDNPNALWTRPLIESVQLDIIPQLNRIGIGVDPSVTDTESSDECGIVAGGVADNKAYLIGDWTRRCRTGVWAKLACDLYNEMRADFIVAEVNQGGDLVEDAIHHIDPSIRVIKRNAHTDKLARADAVVAKYEQGQVFHKKGILTALEDEMCFYDGTGKSPNRLDAAVWLIREFNLVANYQAWEKRYGIGA
jgi:phage terminase large subunit-like protein